jgi:hypothetical protein
MLVEYADIFLAHLTVRGETLPLPALEDRALDHLRWEAPQRAISRGGLGMSPIDTAPIERSVR